MLEITNKKFENLGEVIDFFRNNEPQECIPNIFLKTDKIKVDADDIDTEGIKRMKICLEDLFLSMTPNTLEEFLNRFFYYLEKMYGIVVDRISFSNYSIDFYVSVLNKRQEDYNYIITIVRFSISTDIKNKNGFEIQVLNFDKNSTKLVLRYENKDLFKFSIIPSKEKKDFKIIDSFLQNEMIHVVADSILSKHYKDKTFNNYYDKNGVLIGNSLERPFLCLRIIELIEFIKEEQKLDKTFAKIHYSVYSVISDIEKLEEEKCFELKANSFRKLPEYQRYITFYKDRIVFKISLNSSIDIKRYDGDELVSEKHESLIDNIGENSFFEIKYDSYQSDEIKKFIDDFLFHLHLLFESSNRCVKNSDDALILCESKKKEENKKVFQQIISKRNLKKKKSHIEEKIEK